MGQELNPSFSYQASPPDLAKQSSNHFDDPGMTYDMRSQALENSVPEPINLSTTSPTLHSAHPAASHGRISGLDVGLRNIGDDENEEVRHDSSLENLKEQDGVREIHLGLDGNSGHKEPLSLEIPHSDIGGISSGEEGPEATTQSPQQDDHTLQRLASQDAPTRNASNATKLSIPTSLFKDFDGVHTHFLTGEITHDKTLSSLDPNGAIHADPEQWSKNQQRQEPPPLVGMVYYPAPIPAILNLPKRLVHSSQIIGKHSRIQEAAKAANKLEAPSAALKESQESSKARDISPERRNEVDRKKRQTVVHPQKLPPQLRASVFFDHPAIPQQVEVQNESALDTFSNLLDASVDAPAWNSTGFTSEIVKKNRRSTTSLLDGHQSRLSVLAGRRSSVDLISRHAKNSHSKLSLATNLRPENDTLGDEPDSEGPNVYLNDSSGIQPRSSSPGFGQFLTGSEYGPQISDLEHEGEEEPSAHDKADVSEEEAEEELEDEEQEEAPTTLMAELELRKRQLRDRTRTAATAFPQGMHSTLLELEAVAQIEKARRKKKPTRLAWEDPGTQVSEDDADGDDDVPLGMLFPAKNGLVSKHDQDDWNKPLGLVAAVDRDMNEPLSHRRNRLKGIPSNPRLNAPSRSRAVLTPDPEDLSDPEHQGETLAQRTRRLRTRKVLDEALLTTGATGHTRAISDDFASEMMSQFGGLSPEQNQKKQMNKQNNAIESNEAEETLGQRRKRLQAEAQARTPSNGRPDSSSPNLAHISTAPPLDGSRQVSNQTQSSPLGRSGTFGANGTLQFATYQQSSAQNDWAHTWGKMPVTQPEPFLKGMQSHQSLLGGVFSQGLGGGVAPGSNKRPIPPAGLVNSGIGLQTQGLPGLQNQTYGFQPGFMPLPSSMSPSQRENIDRWRQSVMP